MTRQDHRFSAEAFLSDRHEHDKVVWLDRRIERHNANAERDLLRWAMTRGQDRPGSTRRYPRGRSDARDHRPTLLRRPHLPAAPLVSGVFRRHGVGRDSLRARRRATSWHAARHRLIGA